MSFVKLILYFLFIFSCSKQDSGFAPGVISTVSGSIEFASLNGGDFGASTAGSIVERTINLSVVGSTSLTQVESTVNLPFKYKGGAYPGVGGTCGTSISSSCSIVLNFEPTAAGNFSANLNFTYQVSGRNSNSSLLVTGAAILPPPTELAISGSDSVQQNQCVPFILNSVISGNINSAVAANTTVSLAINSGTGTFYSDVVCSLPTTTAIVSAGQSSQTVYFKSDTAPQTPTLVATSGGYESGTKVITVASAPTKLLLSVPIQVVLGDCRQVRVSRLDSDNLEVASLSTTNINLSQNGSMGIFSDSACSDSISTVAIASGASNQSFYVSDGSVQSVALTATDTGGLLTASTKNISFVSTLQWWNTSFTKRIQITIDNKDQPVSFTNQAVLVKLDSSVLAYSNMNSDGADIRFVASDHSTLLNHQIEKWNVNGSSYIWVNVNSIVSAADTSIFMYFGNSSATSSENAAATFARYSSVWHLNESPVGTAPQFQDVGISARHGTASNSPSSTAGIIGEALDFNGLLDSIDVGNLAPILGVSSTLSFWVNTSMTGNNTNYVAPGVTGVEESGGTNDIFWGWIDASGYLAITAGNGTGAKSLLKVNDNVWRHVAISRNANTGAVAFYVNGVLNNTGTSGVGAITQAFSKFGIIPKTNESAAADFNGQLDEIRIEAGALNSDQIKADFKFQNNSQLSYSEIEIY